MTSGIHQIRAYRRTFKSYLGDELKFSSFFYAATLIPQGLEYKGVKALGVHLFRNVDVFY